MSAFEKAFEVVKELTIKFQNNIAYYTRPEYQEAEARADFIDKFFIALGWDVKHDHQHNPYEQEVKVEKSQKQIESKAKKRADYAFYIHPNFKDPRFFVEAKKPSVELKHPDNYFQIIRYGHNSTTPIGVLTDFEQFHIIDCRNKAVFDTIFHGQHKEYRYTDYLDKDKFAEIYWLFSREAVANNSLIKYADQLPKPKGKGTKKGTKGYQSIDDSFLEYINAIREDLAKALKKNDEKLDSEQLTEAVTRIIDRLVFIRFLEDKLIEPVNHVTEWKSWKDFINDCRKLDAKYNGVVFKKHFIDDQNFSGAEEKIFLKICKDICDTHNSYLFSYIPIHILGSIYEQFLGKIVIATNKRVHIDEKPEVRKAGGVYYTPKYIVDYIVQNTIGKLIEGKTPKQISEMRFADIACGSGSFLIGVYDYLLEYHKRYYVDKLNGKKEIDGRSEDFGNVEFKDGIWVLTLKLKQDILLNNIYGVDIDRQAVEVTQLSLFLKMLEDETVTSTQVRQGALFSKVLPDLSKNIVCGNSLIGFDIMNGELYENDELKKLNPLDYETAFPSIMKNGGFDAIVGNPPYVRQESLGIQKDYFQKKYKVYHGMADLYTYFFEKGINLLKREGLFAIIVGSKWMRAKYGEPLRKWLKEQKIIQLIDFLDLPVFKGATTYTCISIIGPANEKSKKEEYQINVANVTTLKFEKLEDFVSKNFTLLPSNSLTDSVWTLGTLAEKDLNSLLRERGVPLKSYVQNKIYYGIKTGYNKAFVIDRLTKDKLISEDRNSEDLIKPYLAGKNIKRYEQPQNDEFLIFTRRGTNIENYPAIKNHLLQFKNRLTPKPKDWKGGEWKGRKPGPYKWFEIQDTVEYWPSFEKYKILWPGLSADVACFTLDKNKYYGNDNNQLIETDDLYLLGILNSSVSKYFLSQICDRVQGGFYRLKMIYIEQIPIKQINSKKEIQIHNQIVTLVTKIIEAKNQILTAKTEGDKEFLYNKFISLDKQVDYLVYNLYELTDDQVRIIEQK